MQDVFYEETATVQAEGAAKTKYYIAKTMSIISYVIAFLWFFVIMLSPVGADSLLSVVIVGGVPFILFLVSGILIGRLKNRFYVDYDYTFVSGSIRFSKIIKNFKRKNILVFDTQNIDKIGKFGSDAFERYLSVPNIKRITLTSNAVAAEGKDFYYMSVSVGGVKYLLILECSETFFVNVFKFSGRSVFEEGFFNKR